LIYQIFKEFTAEFHESLIAANGDDSTAPVVDMLDAWRKTARKLEDLLRRSVPFGDRRLTDFVEVERPE